MRVSVFREITERRGGQRSERKDRISAWSTGERERYRVQGHPEGLVVAGECEHSLATEGNLQ